jgi:hypothetical protein
LGRRSGKQNVRDASRRDKVEVQHTLVDVGEDTALGDGDVAEKLV